LMVLFFNIGLIIGLKNTIVPSSVIFLSIYLGSLFGNGQGKVLSIILFFSIGLYLAKKINKYF